jgi:hypothetical protein
MRVPITTTELFEKLSQLEEQARLASQEYPHGLVLERLRYISALTRLLRASVERDLQDRQGSPAIVTISPAQESA